MTRGTTRYRGEYLTRRREAAGWPEDRLAPVIDFYTERSHRRPLGHRPRPKGGAS